MNVPRDRYNTEKHLLLYNYFFTRAEINHGCYRRYYSFYYTRVSRSVKFSVPAKRFCLMHSQTRVVGASEREILNSWCYLQSLTVAATGAMTYASKRTMMGRKHFIISTGRLLDPTTFTVWFNLRCNGNAASVNNHTAVVIAQWTGTYLRKL